MRTFFILYSWDSQPTLAPYTVWCKTIDHILWKSGDENSSANANADALVLMLMLMQMPM